MERQVIEPMKNQKSVNKKLRLDQKRNRTWSFNRKFRRQIKLKYQLHMMRLQMGEH